MSKKRYKKKSISYLKEFHPEIYYREKYIPIIEELKDKFKGYKTWDLLSLSA